MKRDRQKSEAFGRDAEDAAAIWLEARGWTILARRARTKAGEVDLIARRDAVLSFVEVKARANAQSLAEAIDTRRLRRVAAAAELLWPEYEDGSETMQIDVLLLASGAEPVHLANVWHEGMA